jgi:hypothetical protein
MAALPARLNRHQYTITQIEIPAAINPLFVLTAGVYCVINFSGFYQARCIDLVAGHADVYTTLAVAISGVRKRFQKRKLGSSQKNVGKFDGSTAEVCL